MEFVKIVTFMFPLLIISPEVSTNKPENILIHSQQMLKNTAKRHADYSHKRLNEFNEFVENKLVQHSQALEHLVKLVNEAIIAINALAEKEGCDDEKPKLSEKNTRRMGMEERIGDVEEVSEHPIVSFGKNIEKYSTFFKDIIMKGFQNDVEPIPVVARKY